jgi:hypothetical protein
MLPELDYIKKESNSRIPDSLDFGSEDELRGAKTFSFLKLKYWQRYLAMEGVGGLDGSKPS